MGADHEAHWFSGVCLHLQLKKGKVWLWGQNPLVILCNCHVISEFHIISPLNVVAERGPGSPGPPGIVAVLVAVHILQTIAQGSALRER